MVSTGTMCPSNARSSEVLKLSRTAAGLFTEHQQNLLQDDMHTGKLALVQGTSQ